MAGNQNSGRRSPTVKTVASLAYRAQGRQGLIDPAWIRDVQDQAAVKAGCWFDPGAGEHVLAFFRTHLRHSKGQWAGQPFELLPWQADAVLRLFGWKRADGTRRYRRGYIEVPKKNGKSTLMAGIELYLLVADGEPGAEVYAAGVDRDNAAIVFDEAAHMIRSSPMLSRILEISETRKTVTYRAEAAKFRALSSDTAKQEGLNIHGLCYDELHAIKSRSMWDTLKYGGASRRQPLHLAITTAGVFETGSIGWEQHEYARKVISGVIEDWAYFALIYGAAEGEDWTEPAVWARANPSWGITINPETFGEECRAAQQSPVEENSFRRYRLNQWVQQITRWIPLEQWDANAGHPVSRAACAGRACQGGLDLGSVSDLTALVWLFDCLHEPQAVDILCRCWIPEAALTAPKNPNKHLYRQWVAAGLLDTTPGNVTDYDFIESAVMADAKVFKITGLGIDRLFQGQSVSNHLVDAGVPVVEIGQGFLSMGPLMKEFERKWRGRQLHHGGHPILRWMADNVETKQDPAGNLKIVKPNSVNDPRKVDGIVALVMALEGVVRRSKAPEYQLLILGGSKKAS